MAVTSSCRTTSFPDRNDAHRISRRVRLANQIKTRISFCEQCKAWHLYDNDARVDKINREVLRLTALGLRAAEIAVDLNLTRTQVENRIKDLSRVFKAVSRAHLIATAIWLNAIDLQPLMPQFDDPKSMLDVSSKGHDAEPHPAHG